MIPGARYMLPSEAACGVACSQKQKLLVKQDVWVYPAHTHVKAARLKTTLSLCYCNEPADSKSTGNLWILRWLLTCSFGPSVMWSCQPTCWSFSPRFLSMCSSSELKKEILNTQMWVNWPMLVSSWGANWFPPLFLVLKTGDGWICSRQ